MSTATTNSTAASDDPAMTNGTTTSASGYARWAAAHPEAARAAERWLAEVLDELPALPRRDHGPRTRHEGAAG